MSNPKEPFFFEAEYSRGPTYYFNRYFSDWRGQRHVGEARHRNLYLPHVARRIHSHNPNARLLVILRNPTERAVSHWWYYYSRFRETLPLHEALVANLDRIKGEQDLLDSEWIARYAAAVLADVDSVERTYLESGYYLDQIDRYLRLFDADHLRVVLFEDFVRAPRDTIDELLDFLGIGREQSQAVTCDVLNASGPTMLQHVNNEVIEWLNAHYRPHNARLAAFLGRPLSEWDNAFGRARDINV